MDSEPDASSEPTPSGAAATTTAPSALPASAAPAAIVVAAAADLTLESIAALAGRELPPSRPASPTAPTAPTTPADAVQDPIQDSIYASGVSAPLSVVAAAPAPGPAAPRAVASRGPPPPASPPYKLGPARRPLPTSAPSSDAARRTSASGPAAQSRRPSTSNTSRASSERQEKMVVAEKDGRNASSKPPPISAANGDRATEDPNGPVHAFEEEIVVGTNTNGIASALSPVQIPSDQDDVPMGGGKDSSPKPQYPKRKRSSAYNEPDEDRMERPAGTDSWAPAPRGRPPKSSRATPPAANARSVYLGYWRDSVVPDVKDRHAVLGFIDTLDRLRTRVQQSNRSGKAISADYPLPPGPGGSQVTFERIVFENHLVGLDHNQIKEYVRIRSEAGSAEETPEEAAANEKAAAKEAMRRAAAHPLSENPQVAYGVDLPDYVVNANRHEKKRRVTSNGFGAAATLASSAEYAAAASAIASLDAQQQGNGNPGPAGAPSVTSAIQRSALDLLPGTRPTKILLGYWRGSSEERLEDKHAVFGILGANDMFRVKVTRETRDGRPVLGNFPQGAGALWIHYDEVEFEKHIRDLSRPEVKEYVRVRQRQIDEGERPSDRIHNEANAVVEAQARVIKAGGVAQSTLGTAGRVDTISFATAANLGRETGRMVDYYDAARHERQDKNGQPHQTLTQDDHPRRESSGHDPRQGRHALDPRDAAVSIAAAAVAATNPHAPRAGRLSLSDDAGFMVGRTPLVGHAPTEVGSSHIADRVERTNSLARREISRVENIQLRNEQRASGRDGAPASGSMNPPGTVLHPVLPSQLTNGSGNGSAINNGAGSRQAFSEDIGRLNKVWESQEASRQRAAGEEASRQRAGWEDAKVYMGVRYERKQTGPFQGKLVSPGAILSIDGEDYVEYRVLTKPTFF